MGGKKKSKSRSGNNTTPSNSSRSVDLLGELPRFVGFSSHPTLGLVPVAPGFSNCELLPEQFTSKISKEFQLVFKKALKKNVITKRKALQEFVGLVKESTLKEVKEILPVWPKFYYNLATEQENSIREWAQISLKHIVEKCKKYIAPYLKQFAAIWLLSRFDIYGPAALVATKCFNETFLTPTDRTQEVLLHCRCEIIEYFERNLIIHTPVSLGKEKNLQTDEVQRHYCRIIGSTLKAFSFFVRNTAYSDQAPEIKTALQTIIQRKNFWKLFEIQDTYVRAGCFELVHSILCTHFDIMEEHCNVVNLLCFKNIKEDCDELIVSQVWECLLSMQTTFPDWYQASQFTKICWPDFRFMLENRLHNNTELICPYLKIFISNLYACIPQRTEFYKLMKELLVSVKNILCFHTVFISNDAYVIIIKTYFHCVRFVIKCACTSKLETFSDGIKFMEDLFVEHIMLLLQRCFCCNNNLFVNVVHRETAILMCCIRDNLATTVCQKLYEVFWQHMNKLAVALTSKEATVNDFEKITSFINRMNDDYQGYPTFLIMLDSQQNEEMKEEKCVQQNTENVQNRFSAAFKYRELKEFVSKLLKFWSRMILESKAYIYIQFVCGLIKMFNDKYGGNEIFECITSENTVEASLNYFYRIIKNVPMEHLGNFNNLMDIFFNNMQKLDSQNRCEFISDKLLLSLESEKVSAILERLLMHPIFNQEDVRHVLAMSQCNEVFKKINEDIIPSKNKITNRILCKYFHLNNEEEILISAKSVETIVDLISDATNNLENVDIKSFGVYLAKTMPVICLKDNASDELRSKVFLCLLHMSTNHAISQLLSQSDMFEINTAWQNAIINNCINYTPTFLNSCSDLMENKLRECYNGENSIDLIFKTMLKFITLSMKSKTNLDEGIERFDVLLEHFFILKGKSMESLLNVTQFIEIINGVAIPVVNLKDTYSTIFEMKLTLIQAIVNFNIITKLLADNDSDMSSEDDDDSSDSEEENCYNESIKAFFLMDPPRDSYIDLIVKYVNIAAAAQSLADHVDKEFTMFIKLCEILIKKVSKLLRENDTLGEYVKMHLIHRASGATDVHNCRSLLLMECLPQYVGFEKDAIVMLFMELSEYFIRENQIVQLALVIQYFHSKLSVKSLPDLKYSLSCIDSNELWFKCLMLRNMIKWIHSASYNTLSDKKIILCALELITFDMIQYRDWNSYLTNEGCMDENELIKLFTDVERIRLVTELLIMCPSELQVQHWSVIRTGFINWLSSLTYAVDYAFQHNNAQAFYLVSRMFKLFETLMCFVKMEQNSSYCIGPIKYFNDEWSKNFSYDMNLFAFNVYRKIVQNDDVPEEFVDCWKMFQSLVSIAIEIMDHSKLFQFACYPIANTNKVMDFFIKSLSSPVEKVRITSMNSIRELAPHFIDQDTSKLAEFSKPSNRKHLLMSFDSFIKDYESFVHEYNEEFDFKIGDLKGLSDILPEYKAFGFLMLWDCIMYIVAAAPIRLRMTYTAWLSEKKHEENIFRFIFRVMPLEVLKNFDNKVMKTDAFNTITWSKFKKGNVPLNKYACHLYIKVLNTLPALMRNWWNHGSQRRKSFINTLTKNYATHIVCSQEFNDLKASTPRKTQVTSYPSTRQVKATFPVDDARMELIISMPPNYPLGTVTVSCSKQIGDRETAHNITMQLSLFLTRQNGTLRDGLVMCKNHLHNRLKGMEECFICYSVLQYETHLFPKMMCKTCYKKFHGSCLYTWFTTSGKASCPICRNLF